MVTRFIHDLASITAWQDFHELPYKYTSVDISLPSFFTFPSLSPPHSLSLYISLLSLLSNRWAANRTTVSSQLTRQQPRTLELRSLSNCHGNNLGLWNYGLYPTVTATTSDFGTTVSIQLSRQQPRTSE